MLEDLTLLLVFTRLDTVSTQLTQTSDLTLNISSPISNLQGLYILYICVYSIFVFSSWGWNCEDSSPRGGREVPSVICLTFACMYVLYVCFVLLYFLFLSAFNANLPIIMWLLKYVGIICDNNLTLANCSNPYYHISLNNCWFHPRRALFRQLWFIFTTS